MSSPPPSANVDPDRAQGVREVGGAVQDPWSKRAAVAEDIPDTTGQGRRGQKRTERQRTERQRTDRQEADREASASPRPKSPIRYRVLPRTLLGITSMILALAVGAAFSGVVLFTYYQYRLDQTNAKVNALITGYTKQFRNAEGQLTTQTNQAKAQIEAQLAPLQQLEAQANTLTTLVKQAGPSLYFVHTLDRSGQPSVGSAFVVASDATQSLLLTSYTTIAAATRSPAPPVYVQQSTTSTLVTVRTWDPTYDLALIVLPHGGLPALAAAPPSSVPSLGERVFALSGLGASGGSISQGAVTEVSANGIEHNTPISAAYQGGPLLDSTGQVVGVTSRAYSPLGFVTDGVWFAPFVDAACQKVLDCPGGSISAST